MKDGTYVVIQSFMVRDFKLKGNELIVYAVIFGFTQDREHWFYGTKGYLAEWCGATKGTVGNCLKSLTEKGLLERRERVEAGQIRVEYRATDFNTPHTNFDTPPHRNCDTPHTNFVPVNKIEEKPSTQDNEVSKKASESFDSIIAERTDNEELRTALTEFVKMRQRIKKPLTNYALKLRLNKLWKLGKTDEERVAIVNQSVGACWQDFFEIKDYGQSNSRGHSGASFEISEQAKMDFGFDGYVYDGPMETTVIYH